MLQQGGVGAKIFSAGLGGKQRKPCPGAELQAGLWETLGAEGERGGDGDMGMQKKKGCLRAFQAPLCPIPPRGSWGGSRVPAVPGSRAATAPWGTAAHVAAHPKGTGRQVLTDAFNIG